MRQYTTYWTKLSPQMEYPKRSEKNESEEKSDKKIETKVMGTN